jgi:hypothetical protein
VRRVAVVTERLLDRQADDVWERSWRPAGSVKVIGDARMRA